MVGIVLKAVTPRLWPLSQTTLSCRKNLTMKSLQLNTQRSFARPARPVQGGVGGRAQHPRLHTGTQGLRGLSSHRSHLLIERLQRSTLQGESKRGEVLLLNASHSKPHLSFLLTDHCRAPRPLHQVPSWALREERKTCYQLGMVCPGFQSPPSAAKLCVTWDQCLLLLEPQALAVKARIKEQGYLYFFSVTYHRNSKYNWIDQRENLLAPQKSKRQQHQVLLYPGPQTMSSFCLRLCSLVCCSFSAGCSLVGAKVRDDSEHCLFLLGMSREWGLTPPGSPLFLQRSGGRSQGGLSAAHALREGREWLPRGQSWCIPQVGRMGAGGREHWRSPPQWAQPPSVSATRARTPLSPSLL